VAEHKFQLTKIFQCLDSKSYIKLNCKNCKIPVHHNVFYAEAYNREETDVKFGELIKSRSY